jgi:hypothetical protein
MQNLAELTRRLIEARVDFVLIGGFAALSHGVMRSTRDVDVCCRFTEANLKRIQGALADLNPVHFPRMELPSGKCRVLDIDTLILAKEAMNRDHDRITARELKEIKKRRLQK